MALEMINPYSKYELKRRPTYDEIAGLIGENETLTGSLPDRKKDDYTIVSQDLNTNKIDEDIAVNTEEKYNRVSDEMFKFHETYF